jgi:hypothetical protein
MVSEMRRNPQLNPIFGIEAHDRTDVLRSPAGIVELTNNFLTLSLVVAFWTARPANWSERECVTVDRVVKDTPVF